MPSFRRIKDFEYQSFHVVIAERDGWVRAAGYTSTNTLVATVESETAGEAEAEIKGTLMFSPSIPRSRSRLQPQWPEGSLGMSRRPR